MIASSEVVMRGKAGFEKPVLCCSTLYSNDNIRANVFNFINFLVNIFTSQCSLCCCLSTQGDYSEFHSLSIRAAKRKHLECNINKIGNQLQYLRYNQLYKGMSRTIFFTDLMVNWSSFPLSIIAHYLLIFQLSSEFCFEIHVFVI